MEGADAKLLSDALSSEVEVSEEKPEEKEESNDYLVKSLKRVP